ncbi:MAG: hydratase, partial [Collinsella intestinalis]
VYLEGAPAPGVGPQDIALAIVRAVFDCGYVKNAVMEFVGPGVASMPTDYRNGVDVMTTETTCLTSIWRTDEDTRSYLAEHGREADYRELNPAPVAYYDGCVRVDLSAVRPMIALPFHPSNAYTIEELNANLEDILHEIELRAAEVGGGRASLSLLDKIRPDGRLQVQQGVIAGARAAISPMRCRPPAFRARPSNGEFALGVPQLPACVPGDGEQWRRIDLTQAGAIVRTAFCGPGLRAGDTPANNGLSIRHTTRNVPNREGSKPGNGQLTGVALMDARSIAATAAAGGVLTAATDLPEDVWDERVSYHFDASAYEHRVYQGFGAAEGERDLVYGPNIKDWPDMEPLAENILLRVASKIMDDVTTTDELIPSGETSSYRSNPLGLAEFTEPPRPGIRGSRRPWMSGGSARGRCPRGCRRVDGLRRRRARCGRPGVRGDRGSTIYAVKPGDGSAREQAASCQRVLGGLANITREYATKRYRSNVMNWGMVPFQMKGEPTFEVGDYVYVPGIRSALEGAMDAIPAWVVRANGEVEQIELFVADMTPEERAIVKAGCLINYNRDRAKNN